MPRRCAPARPASWPESGDRAGPWLSVPGGHVVSISMLTGIRNRNQVTIIGIPHPTSGVPDGRRGSALLQNDAVRARRNAETTKGKGPVERVPCDFAPIGDGADLLRNVRRGRRGRHSHAIAHHALGVPCGSEYRKGAQNYCCRNHRMTDTPRRSLRRDCRRAKAGYLIPTLESKCSAPICPGLPVCAAHHRFTGLPG